MIRKFVYVILIIVTASTLALLFYRRPWRQWRLSDATTVAHACRLASVGDEAPWTSEIDPFEQWRVKSKEEAVTFYVLRDAQSNEHMARRGILVTRPGARATIVVMHGYTSGKTDMGVLRLMFSKHNIFLFDFRAHGEDVEGQMSTFGYDEVFDVFAAVDFLRARPETKDLPLIGYGFSMGAATAIEAQARDPQLFSALILDCPFDSSDNLIRRGLDRVMGSMTVPFLDITFSMPGKEFFQKYAFHPYVQPVLFFLLRVFAGMDASRVPTSPKKIEPIESVHALTIPLFFITCIADERVPLDAIVGIYANAPGYKRLWVTKGSRHYGSIFNSPELYQHMVGTFIDKVLSKTYLSEPPARVMVEVTRADAMRMHERLYDYQLPDQTLSVLYPARGKVCVAQ